MLYKCPHKSPRGAETKDSYITYWSKGLCLIEAKTVKTYHIYHLNPVLICSVAGNIFYKVDLILTKNIFQICHTSRKSTNTIIFFLVSPPNFRSFLSDKCHSHKNRRKRPENGKKEVRCGGLRWTQSGNILFVSCLYIWVTKESTCKPLKNRCVFVCLPP